MSGLFHRLAAQAIGQPGPVRSTARLRYMAPPPLPDHAAEVVVPASQRNRPPATDAFRSAGPALPAERQPGTRPDAEAASPQPQPNSAPIAAPDLVLEVRPGEARIDQPRASPNSASVEAVPEPSPIMPRKQNAEVSLSNSDERRNADPETTFAAPLLPAQRAAPLNGSDKQISVRRAFGPAEGATEVHVNIGRIEVTAVHDALPSPRRAPPRDAKPMSLEEYLARRRGERA